MNIPTRSQEAGRAMSTDTAQDIKDTVRRFISHSVNLTELNDDDNLFESGIVNSLFAVQLMTFIEKAFGIEVGMDDLDIENFKSLSATTAFVTRKSRSGAASSEARVEVRP
jgi:acyl carrier protein